MKEIIYIQAGNFSNYTGAHCWNTQESYFSYNDSDDSDVEAGISFCESADAQERSTLYPRLLLFDRKSNFGTLAGRNALASLGEDVVEEPALWTGGLAEYRQEPISKSTYQRHMEKEEESEDPGARESQNPTTSSKNLNQDVGDVRYWSDFSRVYYLPRSLQKLPEPPDWEETGLDWSQGQELFRRFNEESEVMDGAFRLLIEDCDNVQGVQIMNDTDTFGSFMGSFLASLRDEYLKLPSFTFPVISGVASHNPDGDDTKTTRKLINEAFYLRTLNEFSSMNIPIQEPTSWPISLWNDSLGYPSNSVYHQSAVLSAHIESCTLPFRLKHLQRDISSVCGQLNWRGTSPFGELSGVFPFTEFSDLDKRIINFSSRNPIKSSSVHAQLDVTRGFSTKQIDAYEKWCAEHQSSNIASIARIHGPAYPLPSSFPPLKEQLPGSSVQQSHSTSLRLSSVLPTTELYSSISASSNTGKSFEEYALLLDKCVKGRTPSIASLDISLDDLKELANELWTMHDNASEGTDELST
ncbi:mtDNA inheritance protein Dml1 [Flammula alnicola]|nr:mtDNA inheritance protein Dml1 [Flammula alnicola]